MWAVVVSGANTKPPLRSQLLRHVYQLFTTINLLFRQTVCLGWNYLLENSLMRNKTTPLILSVFFAIFMLGSPALHAAQCKGMSKSACSAKGSCSWVESYKTKKGTKVKAFCRSKPGKKKASTSSTKKKSSATSKTNSKTSSKAKKTSATKEKSGKSGKKGKSKTKNSDKKSKSTSSKSKKSSGAKNKNKTKK